MVRIEKIKSRSWVFTFDSSPEWNLNIHLISGEKYDYLIDTGLGSLSLEPVKTHLQTGKPVIVINTHYHWDHVWGNSVFSNSIIISHSLCRQRLTELWDEMLRNYREYIAGEVKKCLPNLVFDDSLYFPEDGIRIFFTPGHTADSASILDERDGVLNAGDNIGDDMEHIVPELECERSVYAGTLRKYMRLGADTIVSGHNAVLPCDMLEKILSHL